MRGLLRFRDFEAAGFVDLQKIAWEWGIRDKSVKKLSANILGCRISKAQQLSNWEAPSLSPSQQIYAATDAWVCREMYLKLSECEKHPLSPEERISPQERAAQEEAKARKEEAAALKKKAAASHRRKKRHKKSQSNDKADPEAGKG